MVRKILSHIGVGTVLLALSLLVFAARSIQPPARIQLSIGLGAFELLVIAASGTMMLVTLLLTSRFGVAWPSFLHPSNYRSSALASLRLCALTLGAGVVFFFGFVVIAISYGMSDTPEPPPIRALDESIPSIMALVAVITAVALSRALILFRIGHWSEGDHPH